MARASARARQAVSIAVLVVGLLALPVLQGVGSPPATSTGSVLIADWQVGGDGWQVGQAESEGAVLLAADLRDHPQVEVRSRHGHAWTAWQPLSAPGDHAPDPGRAEAAGVRSDLSEPAWVATADQVEVRVPAESVPPTALVAVTSDGGDGLAWQPPDGRRAGAAEALSVWPPMIPRSAWDPEGECQPAAVPEYAESVERVYVHHTAIFPTYEPEESDDLVRAVCTFHVEGRGFDDIGYNFLIDRYGRIFQGRAGGILRPVVGAHASGFNTGSAGIAIIGNFDGEPVPPAALESLDRLTAWLFEWHGIDPFAVTPHVSTGGATTPHPEGESVLLPSVVGHRQTATNTSCPGELLFAHVHGADPMVPRIAERLKDQGVPVDPIPSTAVAAQPTPAVTAPAPPAVARVFETVVAAVRTITTRRLDERLLPAADGIGRGRERAPSGPGSAVGGAG